MIKLIFSDLDGTLLDGNGNIPSYFAEVLAQVRATGAIFAPASGRQHAAIYQQFAPYGRDFLIVAENGAFVAQSGEEVFSTTMPERLVKDALQRAAQIEGAFPVYCGKRRAYVQSVNPIFVREMRKYYTQYQLVESFEEAKEPCVKVSVCDAERAHAEKNLKPSFMPLAKELQIIVASNYWLDIMQPNVNKGAAVTRLQKEWGIAKEECLAFGDYLNDYEMLSAVGESYAMENAHPDLKKIAKHIAPKNTEGGVLQVLQQLLAEGKIGA